MKQPRDFQLCMTIDVNRKGLNAQRERSMNLMPSMGIIFTISLLFLGIGYKPLSLT